MSVFLEAEWRKLVLVNYAVNPELLKKYVPPHTELDLWNDTCYVSIVGFMFLNTKVKGVKIPFHINFEEINLRFYVKSLQNGACKRGAVFISEIVPKPAISFIANTLYNEKYQTFPTKHFWKESNRSLEIMYGFKKDNWQSVSVVAENTRIPIQANSEAEFITEHYWGYTQMTASQTNEFAVEHPRWEIYPVNTYEVNIDFENVYGKEFSFLNQQMPLSVMLVEGSTVKVRKGQLLKS